MNKACKELHNLSFGFYIVALVVFIIYLIFSLPENVFLMAFVLVLLARTIQFCASYVEEFGKDSKKEEK